MTNKIKLLVASSSVTIAALGAAPALAAITPAGTQVTNTATVSYSVGGVAQTPVTGANTLTVDRKIIVTALELDASPVSVTINQANTVTTFSVTNSSNDTIDIALSAASIASSTTISIPGASTAATAFAMPSTYVLHTGSAAGPIVTFLPNVTSGTTTTIYVVDTGNVPSASNGQYAGVALTAGARVAGSSGATVFGATGTALGNPVNNVFAETATTYTGATDPKYDGNYIAVDAYIVAAPVLTVTKTSVNVWDPINGTSPTPKAIPGAQVRYCIQVTNSSATAISSVTINDPLPAQVTFVAGSGYINGSVTGAVCNTGVIQNGQNQAGVAAGGGNAALNTLGTGSGTASGVTAGFTFAAGVVSGTLTNSIASGSTETLYFDVTIN